MDHYIEFRVLPDPENTPSALLSIVYSKFHLALAELGTGEIGISFPDADKKQALGKRLRIHGSAEALRRLMDIGWTRGLHDYISQSDMLPVPGNARFRTLFRVQAKSNPDRLRRRMMKRHGVDAATAIRHIPDSAAEMLDLPYLQMKSLSTGRHFRLFFRYGPIEEKAHTGLFNAYGLSREATIPWF